MSAYFVGEVSIHDPEAYATYAKAAAPIIEKYGGKVLAKGGATLSLEGAPPEQRIVIVRFATMQAAEAFRDSDEYKAIIEIRRQSATARAYVVEGET